MLLTELPARKAAGFRLGAADAKSTDADAGEPGSDGPMSIIMLCKDTCTHTSNLTVACETVHSRMPDRVQGITLDESGLSKV